MRFIALIATTLGATISISAQVPKPDLQNAAMVRREMIASNPQYVSLMETRLRSLEKLEHQVMEREAQMRDVSCSHQIVTELRWLIGSTADIERIDARLNALRASLAHPELRQGRGNRMRMIVGADVTTHGSFGWTRHTMAISRKIREVSTSVARPRQFS